MGDCPISQARYHSPPGRIRFEPHRPGFDLLSVPVLGPFIKSRRVLLTLRLVALLLLICAIGYGFLVPDPGENAVTNGLMWGLFWPFVILVSMVTIGASFCAVCPLGFIGHYLTRWGLGARFPTRLRTAWIGVALLVAAYWVVFYATAGAFTSPLVTAALFLGMTMLAIITFLSFRHMAFCKYVCPAGAVIRAFSRVSPVWLTTDKADCNECRTFECARACDYRLSPFRFDQDGSMSDCTLCMDCAQACQSVRFVLTRPSHSLLSRIRKPNPIDVWIYVLLLGVIIVGIRFQYHFGYARDTLPWVIAADQLSLIFPAIAPSVSEGLLALASAVAATLAIALGGLAVAARICGIPFRAMFLDVGYALAPLMVITGLTHVANTLHIEAYAMTANALAQLAQLPLTVTTPESNFLMPILRRVEIFNWIAVVWSLYLGARRIRLVDTSTTRRILAYPFAMSVALALPALHFVAR